MYQISLFDFQKQTAEAKIENTKPQTSCTEAVQTEEHVKLEYGFRGCQACQWLNKKEGCCNWDVISKRPNKEMEHHIYPNCGKYYFLPNSYLVPGMCGNCEHSNNFEYRSEVEYEKYGAIHRDANSPIEEPNIYCTCPGGSCNRRTEYKDLEQPDFGVGHWHRQHEFDTCDKWKLDRIYHRNLEEKKDERYNSLQR